MVIEAGTVMAIVSLASLAINTGVATAQSVLAGLNDATRRDVQSIISNVTAAMRKDEHLANRIANALATGNTQALTNIFSQNPLLANDYSKLVNNQVKLQDIQSDLMQVQNRINDVFSDLRQKGYRTTVFSKDDAPDVREGKKELAGLQQKYHNLVEEARPLVDQSTGAARGVEPNLSGLQQNINGGSLK